MTEQQKHTLWAAVKTLQEYKTELRENDAEEMSENDYFIIRVLSEQTDMLISNFAPYMD